MASVLIIAGVAPWGVGGRAAPAAEPAASAKAGAPWGSAAKVEAIPGSFRKRVVLTQKAAERLAIATEPVHEEPVMRWMMVDGQVEAVRAGGGVEPALSTPPAAPGPGAAPDPGAADDDDAADLDPDDAADGNPDRADAPPVLVRVPLLDEHGLLSAHASLVVSIGDDEDNDPSDDQGDGGQDPAAGAPDGVFVVPRGGGQAPPPSLTARPIQIAHLADDKAQYYAVNAPSYGLKPGQQVRVRVPQPGSGAPRKVIPYSALIYDEHGKAWTYTSPGALVFVREPVEIEYIEGDSVVLTEGPAVGTPVVTLGAAELLGVESGIGH
jgi:hypothetical protein